MAMTKVLKSRLKRFVADSGRSARDISMEATGKPDTIRDILRGKIENPRIDTLQKLARVLGAEVSQLTGFRANGSERGVAPDSIIPIRVVGLAQAGPFMPVDDTSYDDDPKWIASVLDPDFPSIDQIAVEIAGDSIDLVCPAGGYAVCLPFPDTGLKLRDGLWVVADRIRGGLRERTIKQVRVVKPGKYELHPASRNKKHQPISFPSAEPEETIQVFAVVRRFISPLLR